MMLFQVGACIVNPDKKIVGLGYNGFPTGCSDDVFPWTKNQNNLSLDQTKDAYGNISNIGNICFGNFT